VLHSFWQVSEKLSRLVFRKPVKGFQKDVGIISQLLKIEQVCYGNIISRGVLVVSIEASQNIFNFGPFSFRAHSRCPYSLQGLPSTVIRGKSCIPFYI